MLEHLADVDDVFDCTLWAQMVSVHTSRTSYDAFDFLTEWVQEMKGGPGPAEGGLMCITTLTKTPSCGCLPGRGQPLMAAARGARTNSVLDHFANAQMMTLTAPMKHRS